MGERKITSSPLTWTWAHWHRQFRSAHTHEASDIGSRDRLLVFVHRIAVLQTLSHPYKTRAERREEENEKNIINYEKENNIGSTARKQHLCIVSILAAAGINRQSHTQRGKFYLLIFKIVWYIWIAATQCRNPKTEWRMERNGALCIIFNENQPTLLCVVCSRNRTKADRDRNK